MAWHHPEMSIRATAANRTSMSFAAKSAFGVGVNGEITSTTKLAPAIRKTNKASFASAAGISSTLYKW
jgi:hypothetical protein